MKVEQKHLVGDIAYFPLHVVQAMVDEQVRQGNKADPSVFANQISANKIEGGFDWDESVLGPNVWPLIIFSHEFQLIPKSEEHIQAESVIATESVKPKRKIVQVSAAITTVDKVDEYLEYQGTESYVVALCDDGTAWERSDNGNWYKLPDIPQDGE